MEIKLQFIRQVKDDGDCKANPISPECIQRPEKNDDFVNLRKVCAAGMRWPIFGLINLLVIRSRPVGPEHLPWHKLGMRQGMRQ